MAAVYALAAAAAAAAGAGAAAGAALAAPDPEMTPSLAAAATVLPSAAVISLANWVRWLVIERREFPAPGLARQRLEHFARRVVRVLQGGPHC